ADATTQSSTKAKTKEESKTEPQEEVLGPVGLFGLRLHVAVSIREVEARLSPLVEARVLGLQVAAVHDPQVTGARGQRFGAQVEIQGVAVTDVSPDPLAGDEPRMPEMRRLVWIAGGEVPEAAEARHGILGTAVEAAPQAFAKL